MSNEVEQLFLLNREPPVIGAIRFIQTEWRPMLELNRPLAVVIYEHESKRTARQNRRYWAQLREIAEQVVVNARQFSEEVWHEMNKRMFLGLTELPDGSTMGMSTRDLTVSAFHAYRLQVESHAVNELGVRFSQ